MITQFEQLKKRFDEATKRKTGFEKLYKEALRFVLPEREGFTEKAEGSTKRDNLSVLDSTAMIAVSKFVSNLQSSLVPPMKRWTRLVPGDGIPEEMVDQVKLNLDNISNIMFSAIQNSNFDTQIAEAFSDLSIGTSALLCIKGDTMQTPLRFITIPLHELYIEEGPHGKIDTVYRKHKIENRNIKGTWDDAKLPTSLESGIKDRPTEKTEFIECTYPAKVKITKMEKDEQGKTKKVTREIDGYKYIVMHGPSKTFIVERDQESSPWVVFRWSVAPGEIYGRGPVLFALPDIKCINQMRDNILRRASLEASGVWLAKEDGIFNPDNTQIEPGVIISVMETGNGMSSPSLVPLQFSGSVNHGDMQYEKMVASINEIMFADPLGPIDLPVKTATEVSYRQQELAKRIGAAFGRLQYELITPLINRILFVLNEWEMLPTLGDKVVVDGSLVGVKHESPLAAAQDQESLMAIQQFIQFLAGTFGPQMAMVLVQPDKVIQHMAKYLNIPADIQLTQDQLNALKQKLSQMGQMADESMQQQAARGELIS